MPIPQNFYDNYRIKTTWMAIGTGLILGYFSTILIPPFLSAWYRLGAVIAGVIIAVVANQWVVHKYFYGKMRGAFEYIYRESVIDKSVTAQISSARHPGDEHDLESLDLYNALIQNAKITEDKSRRFFCYLAAAKVANVREEDEISIAALKSAISINPTDAVVNFKLARAYERIGSAIDAIAAYEVALRDPSLDTDDLRNFIEAQVQRVKVKGPQQRSPIPGIIYQLM